MCMCGGKVVLPRVASYPQATCGSVQDLNFSSSQEKIRDSNSALGYFQ